MRGRNKGTSKNHLFLYFTLKLLPLPILSSYKSLALEPESGSVEPLFSVCLFLSGREMLRTTSRNIIKATKVLLSTRKSTNKNEDEKMHR